MKLPQVIRFDHQVLLLRTTRTYLFNCVMLLNIVYLMKNIFTNLYYFVK